MTPTLDHLAAIGAELSHDQLDEATGGLIFVFQFGDMTIVIDTDLLFA